MGVSKINFEYYHNLYYDNNDILNILCMFIISYVI